MASRAQFLKQGPGAGPPRLGPSFAGRWMTSYPKRDLRTDSSHSRSRKSVSSVFGSALRAWRMALPTAQKVALPSALTRSSGAAPLPSREHRDILRATAWQSVR
jgi:hypothetical protein